jgi:hypothetical protein
MATIVTAPSRALNWTATATETNEYGRWEWRRHHAAPAVHRAAHPICYLIYPTPTVLCSISSDLRRAYCATRPHAIVSLPSPRRTGFSFGGWFFAQVRSSLVHGRLRRAPQMCRAEDKFGSAGRHLGPALPAMIPSDPRRPFVNRRKLCLIHLVSHSLLG